MKKILIPTIIIAIATILSSSIFTPIVSASVDVSSWTMPGWVKGMGAIFNPNGELAIGSSIIVRQAVVVVERVLLQGIVQTVEGTAVQTAEELAVAELGKVGASTLSKVAGAGAGVAVGLITNPIHEGTEINADMCIDSTSDDFASLNGSAQGLISNCPKSATYYASTPIKLKWTTLSGASNVCDSSGEGVGNGNACGICSGFGAWNKGMGIGTGNAGNSIVLQDKRSPGVARYYVGCEYNDGGTTLGEDLIDVNLGNLWKRITGQADKIAEKLDMKFDYVTITTVEDKTSTPPSPILSVSLNVDPSSSALSSSGGSVVSNLTATVSGTAMGNINYTFYCNRVDAGTNITSPNDGKFNDKSNTIQPSSCSYSSPGTYKTKVIVERGSMSAEDQATIVINSPANKLPIGYFDGTNNGSCNITGWAFDPDTQAQSLYVDVYRDNPVGSGGVPLQRFTANASRPDVNTYLSQQGYKNATGNYGFSLNLSQYLSDGKAHPLYIYAIDTTDSTKHTLLTNSPKTITCASSNSVPVGGGSGQSSPSVDIKVQ